MFNIKSFFMRRSVSNRHILTDEDRDKSLVARQEHSNRREMLSIQKEQMKIMRDQLEAKRRELELKQLQKQQRMIDQMYDDPDDLEDDQEESDSEDLDIEESTAEKLFSYIMERATHQPSKTDQQKILKVDYTEAQIRKVINAIPQSDYKKIKTLPNSVVEALIKGYVPDISDASVDLAKKIILN